MHGPQEADVPSVCGPALHYSSQTGEEFALEFLRGRAMSKKTYESNGSRLNDGGKTFLKDSEKRTLLGTDNRGRYASSRLVPRASSEKMKVLCSFGGKILPRPGDGELRYVGGSTKFIHITKDISWEEFMQKTLTIYNQQHKIKYQVPGEDLEALVSVSCDEDLDNMIEECIALDSSEGSKKLRIFLFSSSDLDDLYNGLGSVNGDAEIQYLVAVNGIDEENGQDLGLASSSVSDIDQLLNLKVEVQDRGRLNTPATELARSTTLLSSPMNASVSIDYDPYMHANQAHFPFAVTHAAANYYNANHASLVPQYVTSGCNYTSQCAPMGSTSVPHSLYETRSVQQVETGTIKETKFADDSRAQKIKGSDPVVPLGNEILAPTQQNNDSESEHNTRHQHLTKVSPSVDSRNPVHSSQFTHNNPDTASNVSYSCLPSHPARVFQSEKIPREHAQVLNRLSKSDEVDSQCLSMTKDFIAEDADPLHERDIVYESSKALAAKPPIPISRSIEDDLLAVKIEQTKTVSETNAPEVPSTTVGTRTSVSQPEDPASLLPEEIYWEEITAKDAMEQAAAFASLSQSEPSQCNPERSTDIIIDINDRFPSGMLSEIFTQAMMAKGCSGTLGIDDTGVSVNKQNHEPIQLSSFGNLAQDEFARKNVSLMDQDHITYSIPNVEYNFATSENEGVNLDLMDSQVDFVEENLEFSSIKSSISDHPHPVNRADKGLQVENPFSKVGTNLQTTDSACEDLQISIEDSGVPVIDPPAHIDLSDLQIIMNDDLEELRELGFGAYGTVYHGKWRGTDVAIKRIKKTCFTGRSSEQERQSLEFWHEAVILSRLHHPNVVALYGVVKDGPGDTLATVTEFMVNGSLRHALQRKDKYWDHRKRLIIAMDAAFGMEYLHSKNIVHFDLKCDNLLVNLKDQSRPICKVGDFGLSKIKRNTLVSGGLIGTLPWMAPELLNGNSTKVSEKVDVFSFGIVMWEILTGEEPYANMHYGRIIAGIVNNTLRPHVPETCETKWKKLMEECWVAEPHQRPSFSEIACRLRAMTSQMTGPTKC